MALIKQGELEQRLGRVLTSEESGAFSTLNAATQLMVEDMLGSSVEEATETDRYYDGGVQHLRLDPCTDVTAVRYVDDDQVIDDTLDTTDYTVEPVNKTLKTMIRYRAGKLSIGINNIKVTAKFSIWGDTRARTIVKNAMLDMLAQGIQNSAGSNEIVKESIEGYSVEYGQMKETDSMKALQTLISPMV